jgi:hypothetical protein
MCLKWDLVSNCAYMFIHQCSNVFSCIFVCVQPYSKILFGVPFPLPTPQGAGIGNSGTCPRPKAALGDPQDKRQRRQTYSGRSARVATRAESQAVLPLIFNRPKWLPFPAMIRLTGGCTFQQYCKSRVSCGIEYHVLSSWIWWFCCICPITRQWNLLNPWKV